MFGVRMNRGLPPKQEVVACQPEFGALPDFLPPDFGGHPPKSRMESFGIGTSIINEAMFLGNMVAQITGSVFAV